MEINLENAIRSLNNGLLLEAMGHVGTFLEQNPQVGSRERFENIADDYQRMLGYMGRNYMDPKRERLYGNLRERMCRCVMDYEVAYRRQQFPFYKSAYESVRQKEMSNEQIRASLEAFTTDMLMLNLEPGGVSRGKEEAIHERHQAMLDQLFNYILVSEQWKAEDEEFFERLVMSPVIDPNDALLLVSAITLSCMGVYDYQKFYMLVEVFMYAKDERIRQRALVGWVLAASDDTFFKKEQEDMIKTAFVHDVSLARVLAEMQKQMLFCINANKDHETIQQEIIPTLIRNNDFRITRNGMIEEREEDPLEDILHPDAAEKRMEQLEESIQRMIDMQKAGSDIYFGGFSQMKRFPFFYTLSNWFMPYYTEHPALRNVSRKLSSTRLLQVLLESTPFCDSDCYSFTLAMESVIERIPANMKELLNSSEALGPTIGHEEQQSAAYIRRMYLQDLYRFFNLYPQELPFKNPFKDNDGLFILKDSLKDTQLTDYYAGLCRFVWKKKNMNAFRALVEENPHWKDAAALYYRGFYELEVQGHPEQAIKFLQQAVDMDSGYERGVMYLAKAYYVVKDYEKALQYYGQLHEWHPEKLGFAVNYALSLSNMRKYEKALALLYKLYYENPESMNVLRSLAWTLMAMGRLEQAEKEYARILESESVTNGDRLNAGYCQWILENISEAVQLFRQFWQGCSEEERPENFLSVFEEDRVLLLSNEIVENDFHLMNDLIFSGL